MKNNRKRRYFSMMELVIVIGIMALLAAIAAPNFFAFLEQARVATAKSQCDNYKNAIQMYGLRNSGRLPSSLQELIDGNYMSGDGIVDPWGTQYQLVVPGPNGKPFDIISYGADRAPGGTDVNADISCWTAPATGN